MDHVQQQQHDVVYRSSMTTVASTQSIHSIQKKFPQCHATGSESNCFILLEIQDSNLRAGHAKGDIFSSVLHALVAPNRSSIHHRSGTQHTASLCHRYRTGPVFPPVLAVAAGPAPNRLIPVLYVSRLPPPLLRVVGKFQIQIRAVPADGDGTRHTKAPRQTRHT